MTTAEFGSWVRAPPAEGSASECVRCVSGQRGMRGRGRRRRAAASGRQLGSGSVLRAAAGAADSAARVMEGERWAPDGSPRLPRPQWPPRRRLPAVRGLPPPGASPPPPPQPPPAASLLKPPPRPWLRDVKSHSYPPPTAGAAPAPGVARGRATHASRASAASGQR